MAMSQSFSAAGYTPESFHRRVGLIATGPREQKVTRLTTHQTGVVKLSPLDGSHPFIWTPLLIPFGNVDGDFMPDDRMLASLQQVIERVPILTGCLERIDGTPVSMQGPNPSLQVRIGKGSVWYTSAQIGGSFEEFKAGGFNYEKLDPTFLFRAASDAIIQGEDYPLFSVKASRFDCGSVVLLVMGCHFVVDGRSTYELLRTWSMLYRCAQDGPLIRESRHLVSYDSELNKRSEMLKNILKKMFEARASSSALALKVTKVVHAAIPVEKFQAFKEKINLALAPDHVSSDDVMVCLGWRAFARARRLEASDPTKLTRIVDVRRLNQPPLLPTAFGNCVLGAMTGPWDASLLLESPISEVCRQVRASLSDVDSAAVRDTATALSQCGMFGFGANTVPFSKDVISTSYANFHPDKIAFDSPALTVTRACYVEGMVSPQPIANGIYSCKVAIDATQVDAFTSDPDLVQIGFTFMI